MTAREQYERAYSLARALDRISSVYHDSGYDGFIRYTMGRLWDTLMNEYGNLATEYVNLADESLQYCRTVDKYIDGRWVKSQAIIYNNLCERSEP